MLPNELITTFLESSSVATKSLADDLLPGLEDAVTASEEESSSQQHFIHSLLLLDDPLVNASYTAYAAACPSSSSSSSSSWLSAGMGVCVLSLRPLTSLPVSHRHRNRIVRSLDSLKDSIRSDPMRHG